MNLEELTLENRELANNVAIYRALLATIQTELSHEINLLISNSSFYFKDDHGIYTNPKLFIDAIKILRREQWEKK